MSFQTDVVVTGTGVVSPIGIGFEPFWQALLESKNGIRVRPGFEETDLPLRIAAPIDPFDGRQYVKPRKSIKMMCRPIQFGSAAAQMALTQAGLDKEPGDPDRTGTLFGTEMFYADPMEVVDVFSKCIVDGKFDYELWGDFAMRDIEPLWMLKYLPNMVTSHVSIAVDARGPSNSICQGQASGLLAIIEAYNLIQRGAADIMIVGGTGSKMTLNAVLYRGMDSMSKRFDAPESASRPFDLNRDGMVTGEGAGAIVLESAESAKRRGVKPLARLAGYSQTWGKQSDADFARRIEENFQHALETADMAVSDIGHVNAHADSSQFGDQLEAMAIHRAFGQTPVVANKGNFGDLGPGSSVVETIATLGALTSGSVPPTRNFDQADPDCPVNVSSQVVETKAAGAIKSSISSTGQIAALVFAAN